MTIQYLKLVMHNNILTTFALFPFVCFIYLMERRMYPHMIFMARLLELSRRGGLNNAGR